jgi:DNA polymerase-1
LTEKRRHDNGWIGKQVKGLGLQTKKILIRSSEYRFKAAVIFDPKALTKLFERYSLPVPPDFASTTPHQNNKSNDSNNIDWCGVEKKNKAIAAPSTTSNTNNDNDLSAWCGVVLDKIRDEPGIEQNDESDEPAPAPTIVALDTETEAFDKRRGITQQNCRMRGLALSYDGKKADYVVDPEAWPMLMPDPALPVVMHNAKFDLAVLDRTGLPKPDKWEDTLIAARLIDEAGEHGLKPLAQRLLGIADPITFEEADRLRMLDPELFNEYARNDARYTYRLWQQFKPELERQGLTAVYNLEKTLVGVVLAMERAGLKVDLLLIGQLHEETKVDATRLQAQVFEAAGCEFDISSTRKTAAVLYDKLGLKCTKKTANGHRSVDHETLESIRGSHPIIEVLLRYRELDKLASTFLKVLPKYADKGGRIHPEYKPLGAVSGRMTCTNPNVQQIPSRTELGKRLRRAFIAEEGHKLVVADFNQMELRVLAHFSEDPLLLNAYAGAGTDLHALTASKMFRRPVDEVTKAQRAIAKMINFGIAYGVTAPGLSSRLRPLGVEVSETQCETFIADYFNTYPGVSRFLDLARRAAQARGYVKSLMGRRRRLQAVDARESRQVQNHIVQGTAADLAKDAMIRLHNALPAGARLVGMIHDEFIVECREKDADAVTALMKVTMQQTPADFKVPLLVDVHVSDNWGDAK